MGNLLEILRSLANPGNLFELIVLWVGFYYALRFLRGSSGLGIVRGLLLIILAVYIGGLMLIGWFEFTLPHLGELLQPNLGALVLILGLLILFQPEIRRAFIRIGENPAFDRFTTASTSRGHAIAEACERLSRRKVGALIVLERSIGLRDFMEGAVRLNADVDPPLLESVFQPGGPLHDGAVLIRGNRILAAGCLLPLSENTGLSPDHGTRHRAAVGVTEKSDALAVVVSEETGGMSLAFRGELQRVRDARELARRIDETLLTSPNLMEEA